MALQPLQVPASGMYLLRTDRWSPAGLLLQPQSGEVYGDPLTPAQAAEGRRLLANRLAAEQVVPHLSRDDSALTMTTFTPREQPTKPCEVERFANGPCGETARIEVNGFPMCARHFAQWEEEEMIESVAVIVADQPPTTLEEGRK